MYQSKKTFHLGLDLRQGQQGYGQETTAGRGAEATALPPGQRAVALSEIWGSSTDTVEQPVPDRQARLGWARTGGGRLPCILD